MECYENGFVKCAERPDKIYNLNQLVFLIIYTECYMNYR